MYIPVPSAAFHGNVSTITHYGQGVKLQLYSSVSLAIMTKLIFTAILSSCLVVGTTSSAINAGECDSIWVTIWSGVQSPPQRHREPPQDPSSCPHSHAPTTLDRRTYTLAMPYQTLGTTTSQELPIASSPPQCRNPPGLNQTCSIQNPCQGSTGLCCGQSGTCGYGPDFCGWDCQRGGRYCPLAPPTKDGRCGVLEDTSCFGWPAGECCSQAGYCGSGVAFCGTGCQDGGSWGVCGLSSSSLGPFPRPSTLA